MKIGVINASSNKDKNPLLYEAVCKAAGCTSENYDANEITSPAGHTIINFGCYADDSDTYSYVEISVAVGMLLNRGIVDFVVTGCSSGQGMMLACNNMPCVICGYLPTPQDAYLFGRINDGNAASLPLCLNYGWCGELNLQNTLNALFKDDFGIGYPAKDSERKRRDTALLKQIKKEAAVPFEELLKRLPSELVEKAEKKLKDIK